MREIKFRGLFKSINGNSIMVFGNYVKSYCDGKEYHEIERSDINDFAKYTVEPETVSQYTGLKDKNGKEIYEGDIISILEGECVGHDADGTEEWIEVIGSVSFEDGMFVFDGHSAGTLPISAYKDDIEIIGNIYSNPELLKETL